MKTPCMINSAVHLFIHSARLSNGVPGLITYLLIKQVPDKARFPSNSTSATTSFMLAFWPYWLCLLRAFLAFVAYVALNGKHA